MESGTNGGGRAYGTGILPAPERKKATTWPEFIRALQDVLVATDFFTTQV